MWTQSQKGTSSDSTIATARQGVVKQWNKRYGLGQIASYSYRQHGEEAANMLANEWANKCQWYYNIWKGQAGSDYVFTPEDLASYVPSKVWHEFVASLPAESPSRVRALAIEALAPRQ